MTLVLPMIAAGGARALPAFDPEAGLTLTKTIAPTTTYTDFTATELGNNAVLAADVAFSVSPSVGYLAEIGGSFYGSWIGVQATDNFRLRGGAGNVTDPNNGSAFLNTSNFPKDGEIHTVVWDYRVTVGRVRLWIDGVFLGEAFTTAGGDLGSTNGPPSWGGGNATSYINGPSTQFPRGESGIGWHNPTGASDLRFYINQLVSA